MTPTIEDLRLEAFSTPENHCGQLSNGGWVLLTLSNVHSPYVPTSDKVASFENLILFAQRCIGAGCEPRVRPLPGQDPSASLAAPAEADQVEGTLTPTLEQFQRWLETVAHMASSNIVPGAFSARCLVNASLVSECRIATKLLMQFKHGAD